MLVECLVERLSGGYPLRQSGVRHWTHAAWRLPHRSRLAPRATRHTRVALMSQLPNNAITDWFGRVSWWRECGIIRRRHRRGSGRGDGGRGRLNVYVLRRCGTRRRLRHFRLNCRGRGNQRFPRLVLCDVARVHNPPRLRVHDLYAVAPVVVTEI